MTEANVGNMTRSRLDYAGFRGERRYDSWLEDVCRSFCRMDAQPAAADAQAATATLVVLSGSNVGEMYRLVKDQMVLGRGDKVDLRVDYNQALAPFGAIKILRDVEQFAPTFIEQPVPGHHRAALAEITRALDTPVLADESVFTPTDALLVAANRMADLVSIKIMKHGGMLAGRKVAAICEAASVMP